VAREGMRVGIIGAGPAGIMAAIEAARQGAQVWLFDTNAMVGRKLLVTGNGRCNISNEYAGPERYVCADARFLDVVFARFGQPETIAYLRELGIPTRATPDGWCYPLSNSAATVADALATALDLAGVRVHLKTKIENASTRGQGWSLIAGGGSHSYEVDRIIVACGGKAYPSLGSKGAFFPVLVRLGHRIVPIRPALVPINGDMRHLQRLQGVRHDVGLILREGDRVLGREVGNVMFTQHGLSGPAAMNLSHHVSAHPKGSLTIKVDLLPHHRDALLRVLDTMRTTAMPVRVALGAVLPAKVPPVTLSLVGLPEDVVLDDLAQVDLDRLLHQLEHVCIKVTGTRGFKHAQLSSGGVAVNEVESHTMASRCAPGLYLCGEVLDVIGPCGGYNLQFALMSGIIAGRAAATC